MGVWGVAGHVGYGVWLVMWGMGCGWSRGGIGHVGYGVWLVMWGMGCG